jgi:hypothetical protein
MTETDKATWPWWWSKDQERYHGPCSDRVDAIMTAWAEDERGPIHVMQAVHDQLNCALYDAGDLAERFDEVNEEAADGDGDPLSEEIPTDGWKAAAKQMEVIIRAAVRKHGVKAWAFGGQTPGEWIDLAQPTLAALPNEAQAILTEIAAGYDPQFGFAESYIEDEIRRLKVALKGEATADEGECAKYRHGQEWSKLPPAYRFGKRLTQDALDQLTPGTLLRFYSESAWFEPNPDAPRNGQVVRFTGAINNDFPKVGPHLEVADLNGATFIGGGWVYRMFQFVSDPTPAPAEAPVAEEAAA